MKKETIHQEVGRAVDEGWIHGSSFVSSILSGALLSYLADMWLGTGPWLVTVGILAGSYSGFVNMWNWSKETEDAQSRS